MSKTKIFINNMITDNKKCYYDLSQDEKESLTGLYIAEFVEQPDYFTDSEEYDLLQSLLCQYLNNPTSERGLTLAEIMKESAVKYYQTTLLLLFEELYERYYAENKRNDGFMPMVNKVNGEIIWVKQ